MYTPKTKKELKEIWFEKKSHWWNDKMIIELSIFDLMWDWEEWTAYWQETSETLKPESKEDILTLIRLFSY